MIFLLVELSHAVVNSVPPSKKPCELAVPSVACPKMLKTFTNLPILIFIPELDAESLSHSGKTSQECPTVLEYGHIKRSRSTVVLNLT